jgi:hypothetical protein
MDIKNADVIVSNEKLKIEIGAVNLGGFYINLTETPEHRWVEVSSLLPVAEDIKERVDAEQSIDNYIVIKDESGVNHVMIDLFSAYKVLLQSNNTKAHIVAKQLFLHYRQLDKLFYKAHVEDLLHCVKQQRITD